jgi:hypothetical protein
MLKMLSVGHLKKSEENQWVSIDVLDDHRYDYAREAI